MDVVVMPPTKGSIRLAKVQNKWQEVLFVKWKTRDPMKEWCINATDEKGRVVRCALVELLDRRPNATDVNLTEDLWLYRHLDEETFQSIAQGRAPRPAKNVLSATVKDRDKR